MITVDLVNEAISNVINRFRDGDYIRYTYHEVVQEDDEVGPEEIHFFIEDELDTLLYGLNVQHNVTLIDMGEQRWYVRCMFRVGECMQVRNFVVERRF